MFGGFELAFGLLCNLTMVLRVVCWGGQNTHICDAIKSNTYCFKYVVVLHHHQYVL